MVKNRNMNEAKKNKKDEFYTQYADIERELVNYREHFEGKVVYCNCDDPEWSNFTKFFTNNFKYFGLKKLICTHFGVDKPSYKLVLVRDENVTNKRGVYEFVLTGNESKLSIRTFTDRDKRAAYERQKGICLAHYGHPADEHFEISEMQADHITPWSKGGKTIAENCQMLCADCNRRKSGK